MMSTALAGPPPTPVMVIARACPFDSRARCRVKLFEPPGVKRSAVPSAFDKTVSISPARVGTLYTRLCEHDE